MAIIIAISCPRLIQDSLPLIFELNGKVRGYAEIAMIKTCPLTWYFLALSSMP
jgi:hypothetical protein